MSLTGYPCSPCVPARRPSFPVDILLSVTTELLETHRTADKGPLGNLQSFTAMSWSLLVLLTAG